MKALAAGVPRVDMPMKSLTPSGFLVVFLAVFSLPAGGRAATHYVSLSGLHEAPYTNWVTAATNIQAAVDVADPGDSVLVTNGVYPPITMHENAFMTSWTSPAPAAVTSSSFWALSGAGFEGWSAFSRDGFWGVHPTSSPPQWVRYDSGVSNGIRCDRYQISSYSWGSKDQSISNWEVQLSHDGTNWFPVDTRSEPLVEDQDYVFEVAHPSTARHLRIYVTAFHEPANGFNLHVLLSHSLVITSVNGRASTTINAEGLQAGATLPGATLDGFQVVQGSGAGVRYGVVRNCAVSNTAGTGIANAERVKNTIVANSSNYGVTAVPVVSGCDIVNNTWNGIFSCGQVENCVVRGNGSTGVNGGGVYMNSATGLLANCRITDNAGIRGGGVYMTDGTVQNCLISGNRASGDGGGIYFTGGKAQNCTIVNNAGNYGGGTFNGTIQNGIVYHNSARTQGSNYYGSSLGYSCTAPPPAGGIGNIAADPALQGFDNPHLVQASPCVDAGNLAFAAGDAEIDGEPRIWGGGVDMGCDEFLAGSLTGTLSVAVSVDYSRAVVGFPVHFQVAVDGKAQEFRLSCGDGRVVTNSLFVTQAYAAPGAYDAVVTAWNLDGSAAATTTVQVSAGYTNYVSPAGGHVSPFTNWVGAATTIQAAVEANIPGGAVRVADGVYSNGGVLVIGGLTNRVGITNGLNVQSVNGPAFTFIVGGGSNGDDAVRCAYVGAGSRLVGFTLMNGHTRADAGLPEDEVNGGAAQCATGSAVSNCVITGCSAYGGGGGAWGGAFWNCRIVGNSAEHGGGAFGSQLRSCVVTSNSASGNGGGAYGGTLENCLVYGNTAQYGAGTTWSTNTFSTIAQNAAPVSGGGVYRSTVRRSIVYGNSAVASWPEFFNSILTDSCTQPDSGGAGCITNDPQYADAAGNDFRLRRGSPCIDAGGGVTPPAADLRGMPRPLDGDGDGNAVADLGAYEFSGTHYVAPGGGHAWPFLTWAGAAHDIQSAVDAADDTDLVLVSNGVYGAGGRVVFGALSNRVAVDKAVLVQSVHGAASTVIVGSGPIGDAAVRGVYLASNACLSGFTVTGGFTRAVGDAEREQGGGGIWCEPGGVASNCILSGCAANTSGGGVYRGSVVNGFLIHNSAASGGGAAYSLLNHCTVIGNSAGEGGGVYFGTGVNCIVYYNSASVSDDNWYGGQWSQSCTTPTPGGSNITNAPAFAVTNDYRLSGNSPCIDAVIGSQSVRVDLDGTPRPLDGDHAGNTNWDLGAHEFAGAGSDTDGDGLSDSNEVYNVGSSPLLQDTDGDMQSDAEEVVAGVNPLDVTNFFAVTRVTSPDNAAPAFFWPGAAGRLYTILTAHHMGLTLTNLPAYVDQPGVSGVMSYTNPVPADYDFYGVRVRLAP
jgi:hypothetical protein